MPINRTAYNALVDDSGLGTDGSLWDKTAIKDVLLDPIDVAISAGGSSEETLTTTGTQTALAPTATFVRLNNASLLTIQGIVAGAAGQRKTFVSVGAGQVDIANEHASATAANRITNQVTGTISLAPGTGRVDLIYDATSARWKVIEHEQGAWIAPAYAAGDFTASGSMTWTVDAGDVEVYRYWLKGRSLVVNWVIVSSTVGGTLSTSLQIKVPGGFSVANQATNGMMYKDGAAAFAFAAAWASSATPTKIQLYTAGFGSTNWAATTNNTFTYGEMVIEVA